MLLKYLKNKRAHQASHTNDDLSFVLTKQNNRTTAVVIAKTDIKLIKGIDDIEFEYKQGDSYFFNGYQSWTDSFEVPYNIVEKNIFKAPHLVTLKYAMYAYGDSIFYRYRDYKLHGYDLFYSRGSNEAFIYNLNYNNAYLIIEAIRVGNRRLQLVSDLKGISLKAGDSIVIFDYCYYKSYKAGLKGLQNSFPKLNKPKLLGYTTWYNYYTNINEETILRDLDAVDEHIELFQIDDGYTTHVGDWLDIDKEKFPNGLKPIVDRVHEKGLKAGIWLAPFAASVGSKILEEHPDWIKKTKRGKMFKAGGNWNGFYPLDLDNKEVLAYLKKVFDYYIDLGFDFFKLDFVYATSIFPMNGKSRAQTQAYSYKLLRSLARDKIILGCGANLMSSYGNFDYVRVGPDVSLIFDDVFFMRMFHRERISTKVTIQNTIYRSFVNDLLFGNDPDVFILREDNNKLSKEQRIALSTINAIFGQILMTSDSIETYPPYVSDTFDKIYEIFKESEDPQYQKVGKNIEISYKLRSKRVKLVYNPKEGVFIDGQNKCNLW